MHSVGIVILKCSYEIDIEGCVTLYRLRPVDVEFMRALHEKVNVVPLIAKADCLTPNEIKKLKDRVSRTQCVFAYGCVCVCVSVCVYFRLRLLVSTCFCLSLWCMCVVLDTRGN